VAGRLHNEGRVEVNYNSQWGTVCDDGWDDTDAGVVCRQLGFGSSGTAVGFANFGRGSGSIWLDNVMCSGNETTLAGCGHLGVGVTISCDHSEDAGVRCSGTQGMSYTIVRQSYSVIDPWGAEGYCSCSVQILFSLWLLHTVLLCFPG